MPPVPPPSNAGADRAAVRGLAGDLPCVRCRYNLRGLSVITNCPECGTPVRATVLAAIDPLAPLLRPIPRARLVAAGLVMWAAGALVAAILTWALTFAEILRTAVRIGVDTVPIAAAGVAAIIISGMGAVALIRPHAGIPRRQIGAAIAGVLAYAPLAWLYTRTHLLSQGAGTLVQTDSPWPERNLLRLGIAASLAVIVLGVRANARLLAARSVLLREGRVDRQTLLVMALVLVVGAMGDALHLVTYWYPSRFDGTMLTVGLFMMAVSAMLFTVGLAGVLLDAWRIRVVVLQPAPSLTQLVGSPPLPPSDAGGAREAHA